MEADVFASEFGHCTVDNRRLCSHGEVQRLAPTAPSPPSLGGEAAPNAADSAASIWSCNRGFNFSFRIQFGNYNTTGFDETVKE